MYNLFLDDQREPTICRSYPGDGSIYDTLEWVIVRNFDKFKTTITSNGMPKLISFDYQLNDKYTGLDCAIWLKAYSNKHSIVIPEYYVHSTWTGIDEKFHTILDTDSKILICEQSTESIWKESIEKVTDKKYIAGTDPIKSKPNIVLLAVDDTHIISDLSNKINFEEYKPLVEQYTNYYEDDKPNIFTGPSKRKKHKPSHNIKHKKKKKINLVI